MRRTLFFLAVIASSLWAMDARVAAQKQQQTLFIKVVDTKGAPVALEAQDVTVQEDGVECKTVSFEAVNWPIKLQVLVDNSSATTNPITSLRTGLRGLFEVMPDGIEMSMYTTAPQPRPIVRPTTEKQKLLAGIDLIAPDSGAGAFSAALFEASTRAERDKTPHFPVIVMVGSTSGRGNTSDRDFQRLQENIIKRAMAVHIVVVTAGGSAGGGAEQTEVGLLVTKISRGRYENITAPTRLATLLPEIGAQIAQSHAKQGNQYRLTYERPANAKPDARISAAVKREGTTTLSIDGRIP